MSESVVQSFLPASAYLGATTDEARLQARFAELFQRFAPYVRRVMPRMGVAERDLDDAMQEVFLAVHRALPGFEGRSSDKTWIYGICIRVCSNHRRRAHRRHELLVDMAPEQHEEASPEDRAVARAALACLDRALDSLPEVQRAAYVLHEVEGLTVKEIGEALGCSRFTLYARLTAARRRIRAAMAETERKEDDHG